MNWTSILRSARPIRIAEFCRQNPIDIAWACGFSLLTDELHGAWMRDMLRGGGDMTLQAHRGSYKTTCLSVVIPLLMLTNPNRNILFMRKTDFDAIEVVEQARRVLLSDVMQEIARAMYGEEITLTRDNALEIDTNLKTSPMGAPQLLGMGTKGSLTGKHADTILTDDIVNLQDRISRAERERTRSIYQELQNIRNRGGRIINTGTPWHREDAFSLMPSLRRYDCYQTGLIDKGKLEELRAVMAPSLFAANYELRHIATESALFVTQPQYQNDATKLRNGKAHVDAAYDGEDYTAFGCAKRDGDTIYAYGRMWRKHVDLCLDAMIADCNRLMCSPVYCENNADKGYLAKELVRRGAKAKGYHEHTNKYQKISTYLRKWWRNIVWLEGTDPAYIAQIMDYTEDAEHDDAPDNAACLCRMLDGTARESLLS